MTCAERMGCKLADALRDLTNNADPDRERDEREMWDEMLMERFESGDEMGHDDHDLHFC